MAEHNIRHALPQGVQLPRPPVNNRLPRAGPGGELGVEPTQEWVRRRLARGAALERVVVPRTFGAQPDGLVVVPGVILGRVCGRRGQCPLPPDAATTWPTAPTRRSTSSSPSSMQRSRGAPTACSAVASSCRPRGALLVESAKQASLALLAVVARLGWSAAR